MGRSGGRGVCLGSVAAQELSGRPAFREAPFHYGPRSVCGRRAAHRAEQVGRVRRGHDAPYRRVARSPHRSAGGPNRCRLFAAWMTQGAQAVSFVVLPPGSVPSVILFA